MFFPKKTANTQVQPIHNNIQDSSALYDAPTYGTKQINNGFNEMRVRYYFIRKGGVF